MLLKTLIGGGRAECFLPALLDQWINASLIIDT